MIRRPVDPEGRKRASRLQRLSRNGDFIDRKILSTVLALNLLGLTTRSSCEGHIDERMMWFVPWVTLGTDDIHEALQTARQLFANKRVEEALEINKQVAEDLARQHAVLLDALTAFYDQRHVPADCRLIAYQKGGFVEFEPQGALVQPAREPQVQIQRLAWYQQEMADFANFLRTVYLEDVRL